MKLNPQVKQELLTYLKNRLTNKTKPKITVIAPYELSQQDISDIKNKIPMLSEAEITVSVDTSIMAGIIIQYGSQMIDLSLKSEIKKLEHRLYDTA
jgi:F0F1-type ATP synthase delta subunit